MKSYLKGRKIGKLTVLEETDERRNGAIVWKCRCDCVREFTVRKGEVLSGNVTDCGCMTNPDIEKIDMNRLDHPVQGRIPKVNKSGCKGVSYNANRDKWMARLMYCSRYKASTDRTALVAGARTSSLRTFIHSSRTFQKEEIK